MRRAQEIFREESQKSFVIDLGDLSRDAWTLLPAHGDFLAELRTRRFDTLTYARSSAEAEDITLFDRKRHRNIALYPSQQKQARRGRLRTTRTTSSTTTSSTTTSKSRRRPSASGSKGARASASRCGRSSSAA